MTSSYTNKIAEPRDIHIIHKNRAMTEPFSEIVDEALLHYNRSGFSSTEDVTHVENEKIESSCENKSNGQQLTQNVYQLIYRCHNLSLLKVTMK